jgi:hypothetical protein
MRRRPRSRANSHTYLNNGSPLLSRLAPGDQARVVRPLSQPTRLRAQAGRALPRSNRLGPCRSPSQGEVATRRHRGRRPDPGPPQHARGQPVRSLRRTAPAATARAAGGPGLGLMLAGLAARPASASVCRGGEGPGRAPGFTLKPISHSESGQ